MFSPTSPLQNCNSSDSSDVEFEAKREDNPAATVPEPIKQPNNLEADRFVTSPAVFDAWLKFQSNVRSGSSSSGFSSLTGSPSWMSTDHLFRPPCIGMIPAVVTPPDTYSSPCRFGLASKMAHNRLWHSKLIKTDDHLKFEALKKLKTIILADPSSSKLGRSLVCGVQMLTDETELAASFADAFAGKAVATLAKRAASLWRFNSWTEANGLGPAINASESVVYRYMLELKEEPPAVPWASEWMDLRRAHNLGLDPALPAWSEISNSGLDRRMTTGEAHCSLREFLASSGFKDELDLVGCHSLKCTLLSWASKGGYLPISDRLLTGHHLTKESQSAVVYGRDELTRIAVVVYQMVRDTKNKKFRPDASRAERVALQVGLMASDGEQDSPSPVMMMMMQCQKMLKQLKVWIVTEQVGMTSSWMSCDDFEFCLLRSCSYQIVP